MQSWVKKVFGFGVASLFEDLSHEMTVSFIPIIVAQFVDQSQVPFFLGIIASTTDAFASLLRLFSGFISDLLPRKKNLIAFGYAISAIFSTLCGFANSLWALWIYRILSFTGSGLREPPRDALIAATVEPENYGRAFGLRNAMDTVGALLGPLVALACVGTFSTRTIFLIAAIPGIFAVGAIIFLTHDATVIPQQRPLPRQFLHSLTLLPHRFLWFMAIMFIFDLSFFNKLLLLARAGEILPISSNPALSLVLLYSIFNIARACCEFFIGLISDYANRVILFAFLGCGLFALTAYLLTAPHGSYAYCAYIFILAGTSTAAITTLKKACAADMLPAEIRGLGYGALQASTGFASLLSSMVIGFLWTMYSPLLAFSYVIILSSAAAIMLMIFGLSSIKPSYQ